MGALITAITNPRNHAALRPKGREPSGNDRHCPKPEPGHPDYFQHESTQPCRISAPQGRKPLGCDRHYPKADPGLPMILLRTTWYHAASRPKGRELLDAWPFPTIEERHLLSHGMSPVATGSGGHPAFRRALHAFGHRPIKEIKRGLHQVDLRGSIQRPIKCGEP